MSSEEGVCSLSKQSLFANALDLSRSILSSVLRKADYTTEMATSQIWACSLAEYFNNLKEQFERLTMYIQTLVDLANSLSQLNTKQSQVSGRQIIQLQKQKYLLELEVKDLRECQQRMGLQIYQLQEEVKDQSLKLAQKDAEMLIFKKELESSENLQWNLRSTVYEKAELLSRRNEQVMQLQSQRHRLTLSAKQLQEQNQQLKKRIVCNEMAAPCESEQFNLSFDVADGLTPALKFNLSKLLGEDKEDDPYYIHYQLLTQQIKIKHQIDDWNRVDMRPLFKQFIQQAVPLHEWADWIQKKMQALTNKPPTYILMKNPNRKK